MKNSIIKKQTIQSTVFAYAGVLVGTITQAFLIPNFLTTEQNGLLALLLSWMYVFCQIASLGFNSAGTKYFSFFRSPEENHRGFLFYGLLINGIGLLIGTVFFILGKPYLIHTEASGTNQLLDTYYFYLLPIAFATVLFNLFDNYARGLYDSVHGVFYSQFLQRLFFLLSLLTLVFGWFSFDQFMPLWVLAMSLPTAFMLFRAIRLGNFSFLPNATFFKGPHAAGFVQFAGFSILTGLSSMIIIHLDKIMIHKYLGLSETGIYNTAFLFASVMGMSYNSVLKASSAIVVDALAEENYAKIQTIYQKSSINLLLFGAAVLLLVWVNVDELFSFIKPEYAAGKWALLLIGIGKLVDLGNGINGLILSNSKKYRYDSLLVISFVGILYVLNEWMIPSFGIDGAAYAALIALVYYNFVRTFLVWYFFRIHPFGKEQLILLLLFTLLVYVGQQLPTLSWPFLESIFQMTFQSTFIGSLFLVGVYVSRVSPEVNQLIEVPFTYLRRLFNP
jgi:O-antigen/teichoic acid export membrane protein